MAIEKMMEDSEEVESLESPETVDETEVETVDVPLTMLGGATVAPGDVIRLEVVSSNDDSGSVTLKYATPKKASDEGIGAMARKFEE